MRPKIPSGRNGSKLMKLHRTSADYKLAPVPSRRSDSGVSLILAILGLLVVSAVAAGMVLVSTSDINIDANYRDQQVALFAAKAGLEEARDRMLSSNANPLTLPSIVPGGSGIYAAYVTAPGVSPWSDTSTVNGVSTYDQEFAREMGIASLPGGTWYADYATDSNYSGPAPNPLPYQWVRINLKTDGSAYTSGGTPYYVDGNPANANKQVCWDSLNQHEVVISAASCHAANPSYGNIYEITSFAVTRSGARGLVQDEVASINFDVNLSAPVSIPGTVGIFQGGASANYRINGVDGSGSAPAVAGCTPNTAGGPAVAVSDSGNASVVIHANNVSGTQETGTNCTYSSGGQACVGASLPDSAASPADLNETLQEIEQHAAACLGCSGSAGTYTYSDVVAALGGTWTNSATNPQVVYVNGNLDISGSSGSGILAVTGDLTYDGNSNWNGIVLVVGQGATIYKVGAAGTGEFNGAMLVATTEDTSGNPLTSFGAADFNINGAGGNGVYYNSCWVSNVQKPIVFELLSSKEISN